MTDGIDERIRARAYALWEQDGRQHGRDLLHWDQATREFSGDEDKDDMAQAEGAIDVIETAKAMKKPTRAAASTAAKSTAVVESKAPIDKAPTDKALAEPIKRTRKPKAPTAS